MDGTFTIGIPVKANIDLAFSTLIRAVEIDHCGEILISINSFSGNPAELERLRIDPRVKVFAHTEDLGLYGNFRFLASKSSLKYFAWNCIDDNLGPSFAINVIKELRNLDSKTHSLFLPNFVTSEYFSETTSWGPQIRDYPAPNLESRKSELLAAIHPEPSWIFGMWETEYLLKIFPLEAFDWLDILLVQRAILEGRATLLRNSDPVIIGTAYRLGKIGMPVDYLKHRPIKYMLSASQQIGYFVKTPLPMMKFLFTILTKITLAKRLNRLLASSR